MQHHHISVTRTARYVTNGECGPQTRHVWFLCHGYGQLAATFLENCQALESDSHYLVGPEALSRFYRSGTSGQIGASWMTREDRAAEITDYVVYLDAVYDAVFGKLDRDTVTAHVLGFSQGVAAACRWIARGHAKLDHLVLWSGRLPPEFATPATVERFRTLRLTTVNGVQDELSTTDAIDEHSARLEHLGLLSEDLRFDGGHRLDKETLRALAGDGG